MKIVLGTRGSALALAQTKMVKAALEAVAPGIVVEVRIIHTVGDKRPDLKLSEFSTGSEPVDKGIFTKELEIALESGEVDAAVHSLKDVPTELDPGFEITAVLPRAPIEDVLVSKNPGGIEALPNRALVATSSVRRARQLRWLRPDLQLTEIRGNVGTRLRKVAESNEVQATMLARAGLVRLGLMEGDAGSEILPEWPGLCPAILAANEFLPAASQGAVGIEIAGAGDHVRAALGRISDSATMACVTAERQFLHLLQAGCQTPVGLCSTIDGHELHVQAIVFDDNDEQAEPKRATVRGDKEAPKAVAAQLFAELRS